MENGAIFLSTRITTTAQSVAPGCIDFGQETCSYSKGTGVTYYVGDPDMFTLMIDHTMNVPSLGPEFSLSSRQMNGAIEDGDGNNVDPCDGASRRAAGEHARGLTVPLPCVCACSVQAVSCWLVRARWYPLLPPPLTEPCVQPEQPGVCRPRHCEHARPHGHHPPRCGTAGCRRSAGRAV